MQFRLLLFTLLHHHYYNIIFGIAQSSISMELSAFLEWDSFPTGWPGGSPGPAANCPTLLLCAFNVSSFQLLKKTFCSFLIEVNVMHSRERLFCISAKFLEFALRYVSVFHKLRLRHTRDLIYNDGRKILWHSFNFCFYFVSERDEIPFHFKGSQGDGRYIFGSFFFYGSV